jgi:flagellar export protein FliJ
MAPTTRLDKVVWLRERAEDDALAALAQARQRHDGARERLSVAVEVSRRDARAPGPVELWHVDELARRRAIQAVRAAENEVVTAARGEHAAREGYTSARQEREVVRRVRERRVAEIVGEADRRERRDADELATLRFNAKR